MVFRHLSALLLVLSLALGWSATAVAASSVYQYSNDRKILVIDGDYVKRYSDYRKVYYFDDDDCLHRYSDSRKLACVDGDYIRRYSDWRKIAYLDGNYVRRYSDARKIATTNGGDWGAAAAAVYLIMDN